MPLPPDLPVLDRAALEPYAEGDPAVERDFYVQFRESTATDCAALLATLEGVDAAAMAASAHRVKGSSRMMGAMRQGELAEDIEKAARAGDAAAARALAAAFRTEHERLIEALAKILG